MEKDHKIEFLGLVASSTHGAHKTGDTLWCNKAFAVHCVETLKKAKYLVRPESQKVANKPKRRTRTKRTASK